MNYRIGNKRYNFPVSPLFGDVTTEEEQPMGGLLGSGINPLSMGLLGLGASMLEASGPSETPRNFGQILGRGMMGGIAGYRSGVDMQKNGGSPYFQFLPTSQGYAVGDARTGRIMAPGQGDVPRLMRGTDDPTLQGRIAGARAGATAPYEFIDQTNPDGSMMSVPKSAIVGGQVPTLPGGAVPKEISPYQKTAMSESAKADVERGVDAGKKDRQAGNLTDLINTARGILKQDPTDTWFEGKRDDVFRLFGKTTDASENASKLETISGWMVSNVPRMEGPQSNFDVQNYMTMAAKVGDRNIPIAERMAALDTLDEIQRKYTSKNSEYKAGANRPPGAKYGGINPATGQMEYFDAQGNRL